MDPSAEWCNKLISLNRATSVDVDHLEKLLQIHLATWVKKSSLNTSKDPQLGRMLKDIFLKTVVPDGNKIFWTLYRLERPRDGTLRVFLV